MNEKKIQIGGQALIEGVMMRGPEHIAGAVHRQDGTVEVWKKEFKTVTKDHPIYKKPIIRGFVSLIEMLKIGIQTLNFSARRYELDFPEQSSNENKQETETTELSKEKSQFKKKIEEVGTIIFAMALAFALFAFLPNNLSMWLANATVSATCEHHSEITEYDISCEICQNIVKDILFNLYGGLIRIFFFVLYVYFISLLKDVRRVFEYHGAEHKAVSAYENKEELTIENVKKYTTIHQRCGTSFMFLVLLISIIIGTILDTIVAILWTPQPWIVRTLYQLPFLPLVSGIGYEIIKLSDKNSKNIFVKLFTTPGMALQKITTKEPDVAQITIAIIALKAALNEDLGEYDYIDYVTYPEPQEVK